MSQLPTELHIVADRQLEAVQRLLERSPGDDLTLERATHLLGAVERALAELAAEAGTNTDTGRRLLELRADLSGHLLAAATLEAAGAERRAEAKMLRRAAEATRSGLEAVASSRSLVTSRF